MGSDVISELLPTLGRTFAVIIIGYLLAKFKFVTEQNVGVLSIIVGKITLPAVILQKLALLDLSNINWRFVAGNLITRSLIFAGVFVVTLIFTRPISIGKPAILSVFCTHINSFALGLPILTAIYGDSVGPDGFDYISYIYLVSPIQLMILDPIAFFCMEYALQKSTHNNPQSSVSWKALLFKTLWNLIINPIFNMTVLGITINLIVSKAIHGGDNNYDSDDNLKKWMKQFLTLLGKAFDASALLYLGISMCGKLKNFNGILILKSLLLCFVKLILSPLISLLVLEILGLGRQISSFGFLFDTIPTGPSVFVYSILFRCGSNLVGPALVLCTTLSAPIIYLSARMVLVRDVNSHDYHSVIKHTRLDCSIVSIVSMIIVFCLFVTARRYRSHVHIFVMHLMAAIVMMCSGAIAVTYTTKDTPWNYFSFTFYLGGTYATRLWSALLSLELVILLKFGPHFVPVRWIFTLMAGWGLPLISTVVTIIIIAEGHKIHTTLDKTYYLGDAQLVLSYIFLGISAIIITSSLIFIILHVISRSRHPDLKHVGINHSINTSCGTEPAITQDTERHGIVQSTTLPIHDGDERTSLLNDSINQSKSIVTTSSTSDSEVITFADIPMPGLWEHDEAGRNTERIIILLFILLASVIIGLFAVSYNASHLDEKNGVYVEVDVLDSVMNYGQGFFLFLLFATEKNWFIVLLVRRVRQWLYHVENVVIPNKDSLDSAIVHLCETFRSLHLKDLEKELPTTKRYHHRTFDNVFTGTELVDWLLSRKLVYSREDGVSYGGVLLKGQVIEHIYQDHYFHDNNYFYHVKPTC